MRPPTEIYFHLQMDPATAMRNLEDISIFGPTLPYLEDGDQFTLRYGVDFGSYLAKAEVNLRRLCQIAEDKQVSVSVDEDDLEYAISMFRRIFNSLELLKIAHYRGKDVNVSFGS